MASQQSGESGNGHNFPNNQNRQNPQNDPRTDEPSESIWDRNPQQSPIGADGVNKDAIPTLLRPGATISTAKQEEENVWDEGGAQPLLQSQPQAAVGENKLNDAPSALNPGAGRSGTNPFLRKKVPTSQTVPPPMPMPPTEGMSNMLLSDDSTNPWRSGIDAQRTGSSQPPPILSDEVARDPWAEQPPEAQRNLAPSPILVNAPSEPESPAWDEPFEKEKTFPYPINATSDELTKEKDTWDDLGGLEKWKEKDKHSTGYSSDNDDWNLVDVDPDPPSRPPKDDPAAPTFINEKPIASETSTEEAPALPPRINTGQVMTKVQASTSAHWRQPSQSADGKTETYQVKNIKWHDLSSDKNPRASPILVQNANGPCPLVALVNALTLTTPPDIPDTALVQVLRSREQVSLSLLLDAVFDELMSPRRTTSEDSLPDVSDLYAFLQSLHTGMNVNPRFVPAEEVVNAYKRTSLTHLHPTERGDLIPGTFESTMEMSLYATFSIPLIHGWLPSRSDPVYAVLGSRAVSYEDAQNLLFHEEELEGKLCSDTGLTVEEQELYHDVMMIKAFLTTTATQLTTWGIEVISKAIRPGTFAILFRNDHFSTLYCHPQTLQLLTLVTDAGYKKHNDVVWETLVDVNGVGAEILSGDFTVVGAGDVAGPSAQAAASSSDGGNWTTVQHKHGKTREDAGGYQLAESAAEQEDRDLALALQLQEEEEQRQREVEDRRRRERILSEQYIEQQGRPGVGAHRGGRGGRGGAHVGRGGANYSLAPNRSSSNSVSSNTSMRRPQTQPPVRPLVPPRQTTTTNRPADANGGDDAPPPTYEQSANDPTYVPPDAGQPASRPQPGGSMRGGMNNGGRPVPRPGTVGGYPGARRPPVPATVVLGHAPPQKDRDCTVM